MLTTFIYKYSIYLIVAALFVDIALMPINALNLILLYLMSRIVLKYFAFDGQEELYREVRSTMLVLKWASALFIFMKYMFQFEVYLSKNSLYLQKKSDEFFGLESFKYY